MKKWIFRIVIAVVVIIVALLVVVALSLDKIVKKGVETLGPEMTKGPVKLASVRLSLLSGQGEISGLVVGNPPGYKTPDAITLGEARVRVKRSTVFADPIVVHSINLQAPEIYFEGGLKGNNLSTLLANLDKYSSSEKTGAQKPGKKIQVEDFVLQGGKIHLSLNLVGVGNQAATVPLPDIHLTGLGQKGVGVTAAELSQQILTAVLENTLKAVADHLQHLGANSTELLKKMGEGATGDLGKAAKGFEDLLKRK